MQVQPILGILCKQVPNLFVVNLKITRADQELCLLRVALDPLEDILKRTRHNTLLIRIGLNTGHCVCFASTSLSIGENGTVVSLEHIFNDMRRASVVNIYLLNIPVEHLIKSKLFRRLVTHWLVNKNLASLRPHVDNNLVVGLHFFLTERSAPDDDLNRLCVGTRLLVK